MKNETEKSIEGFFERFDGLRYLEVGIRNVIGLIAGVEKPNKVMVCGSGGSAADSLHIVGELMKNFKIRRAADPTFKEACKSLFDEDLTGKLDGAIPAVSLVSEAGLMTAVINDTGADMIFAQSVYGLGFSGDVLIGLSTSGNSEMLINACKTAKALDIKTIAFTGQSGGRVKAYADICLNVPETETYRVQELHLPLYHLICACAESERWGA